MNAIYASCWKRTLFTAGLAFLIVTNDAEHVNCQELRIRDEFPSTILTLSGHTDLITDACFSADRNFVATCSRDCTAIVWDVKTGKEQRTLLEENHLTSVAFNVDGTNLLVGSPARQGEARLTQGGAIVPYKLGGAIYLWDWKRGRLIDHVDSLREAPKGFALSQDGNLLSVVDFDFNLFRIDFKTMNVQNENKRLAQKGDQGLFSTSRVVFSHDAKRAIAVRTEEARHPNGNKLYTLAVACWDANDSACRVLVDPSQRFATASLSFDGSNIMMTTLDGNLLYYGFDGKLVKRVAGFANEKVDSLTFDDSGHLIVLLTSDGKVTLKDATTHKQVGAITLKDYGKVVVRSIAMNDRLLILRGGFSYSSETANIDGINKVLPEPLTLESYAVRR